MRAIRLVLGMALLAMVVAVWQRRDPIIEAYTEERAPVQFEFDGLDFEVSQQVDLGSSPLIVPAAPDTKNVVLPTLLAADSIAEATLPSGSVELSGVVTDALGPVPFAIVRVEHHAAGSSDGAPVVATLDITCDDVGRWQLTGVGGGRWRIRAFVPEQLASVAPTVRFVAADEKAVVDLAVSGPAPGLVVAASAPASRELGQAATIGVTVGRRRVDADGIVVVDPVPGVLVEMALGEGPARAISALTAPTDATGIARFGAVCETAGSAPASFVVAPTLDEVTHSAALLECVVPPPPPDDLEDGLADDGSGSADGRAGIDG